MSESTVRPDGPEGQPDRVTPRCGHAPHDDCECFGNDQPSAAAIEAAEAARCCDPGPYCDDLPGCVVRASVGPDESLPAAADWSAYGPCPDPTCYAATGNPCQWLGLEFESVPRSTPHAERPLAAPEVVHFDAGRVDQYAACGYDLDRNGPEGWTTDRARVTCSACELEITPDEDDDLMPAPGCGHPMPPGVDCCVSTRTLVEVPVCLAASRHGGICGQPAPCDGSRHVEPAPVSAERRTVSLETLTPALLAEEEQRRRVEAREQGVSFEPIPAKAKVVVVARINGLLGGVWDTDADWMATRADLLVAMLRSASDFAADGEAELLMPTPDVLAALDGRPDATFWSGEVDLRADQVAGGWLIENFRKEGVAELVTDVDECADKTCPWHGSCTVITAGEPVHFADWTDLTVRIPAAVTR